MPRDYAAKQTDKELAKLERKLSLLYAEAKSELDVLVDNYYNGWDERVLDKKTGKYKSVHHAGMYERYQEEHQAYLDGKYHDPTGKLTDKEMFERWVWSQEGRGKHIEAMRDAMAKNMTDTNQRAAAMINDKTPGIYSLNANWEAYKIEVVRRSPSGRKTAEKNGKTIKGNKLDVAFNLVREQTVKELVTGKNHVEFRVNSVNPKRDYEWNKDQITKALTSGILLGESPYQVANRYLVVMQRNKVAAIRNARTSITSAQNAGCQNTYDRAVEMGIQLQKQWMSTKDDRTRDTHILANGQHVDVDKVFHVGGSELKYPGDTAGAPAEVYNCRCTMVTLDPAVLAVNGDPYDLEGFKQWIEAHRPELLDESDTIIENIELFEKMEFKKELMKESSKYNRSYGSIDNVNDARKTLMNDIGFKDIDKSIDKVDEQILIDIANHYKSLEAKFGAICNSDTKMSVEKIGTALSRVTRKTYDPTTQTLKLNPKYFAKKYELVYRTRTLVNSGHCMPCNKDEYPIYVITHEYGHMFINQLLAKEYEKYGWTKTNPRVFIDMSKSNEDEQDKWYNDKRSKFLSETVKEILDIAKVEKNSDEYYQYASNYSLKNDSEFLAEVFANSQLSLPNKFGKAMSTWMRRKGLL